MSCNDQRLGAIGVPRHYFLKIEILADFIIEFVANFFDFYLVTVIFLLILLFFFCGILPQILYIFFENFGAKLPLVRLCWKLTPNPSSAKKEHRTFALFDLS